MQHRGGCRSVVSGINQTLYTDHEILVRRCECTYIPAGASYWLANPCEDECAKIEVQAGDFSSENNIRRSEDRYGRVQPNNRN